MMRHYVFNFQHGWQYLGGQSPKEPHSGRYIWMIIVLASLGVASVFIVTAVSDFVDKVVVTTIDTTTASLQVTQTKIAITPTN